MNAFGLVALDIDIERPELHDGAVAFAPHPQIGGGMKLYPLQNVKITDAGHVELQYLRCNTRNAIRPWTRTPDPCRTLPGEYALDRRPIQRVDRQ